MGTMKLHTYLLPVLAFGLLGASSLRGQTVQTTPSAPLQSGGAVNDGYILLHGQIYIVRGSTAYPYAGDITQVISPASAKTLREGYLLSSNGSLVTIPSGLSYSQTPAPAMSPQAERSEATRPVTGENTSGLVPSTATSVPVPNQNTTGIQQNGTQPRVPNSTQQNGTQPPASVGAQPNGGTTGGGAARSNVLPRSSTGGNGAAGG